MHNGSFLSHTMSNYGRKKDCKNERRTSGISDTTCSVQPPTLVFRRSWSHYTSPDSLLLIFNQNSFMEDKKIKKTQTAWKMGRALVSSFLFHTPVWLIQRCLLINLYVDQKLHHLHFQDPARCYHRVAHIGWGT